MAGDLTNFNIFDPRLTFESYVVHDGNQLAHAAASRIAISQDSVYNPLFIHGRVGLGKTHLLHAIGNHLINNNSGKKVLYVSIDSLMVQFANSIIFNNVNDFKNNFRYVNVLLVDDINLIVEKRGTQEELFHIINDRCKANKQVIFSSERCPSEIVNLDERLRKQFESGMVVDLHPPNRDSRIDILKLKSNLGGLDLPDDVIQFLADAIDTNVRELEGAMVRILAVASIENVPVSVELARKTIFSDGHSR